MRRRVRPADDAAATPSEASGTRAGLGERLLAWRDRLLSDPDQLRRASQFALARPVVRRQSRALFDLLAGFTYSQVIKAVVDLDILERLRARPMTPADLAGATGIGEEPIARLLVAAEALGLVERRRGGRCGLGLRGAALLGNPGALAMIRHHDVLYRELADPVALMRRGHGEAMHAFWPYAGEGDGTSLGGADVAPYTRLMAASQAFVADTVLASVPLSDVRHLLDVGGGDGTFAIAAARRHPHLEVTVFDLPAVAARATARIAEEGLADRVRAVGGDFRNDDLPTNVDAVALVRILHDHEDATVDALLARARAALRPGGRLIVAEPMAERPGAPGLTAYFTLYLLAMGSGRPRSRQELTERIARAGFADVRLRAERNPWAATILSAILSPTSVNRN